MNGMYRHLNATAAAASKHKIRRWHRKSTNIWHIKRAMCGTSRLTSYKASSLPPKRCFIVSRCTRLSQPDAHIHALWWCPSSPRGRVSVHCHCVAFSHQLVASFPFVPEHYRYFYTLFCRGSCLLHANVHLDPHFTLGHRFPDLRSVAVSTSGFCTTTAPGAEYSALLWLLHCIENSLFEHAPPPRHRINCLIWLPFATALPTQLRPAVSSF